MFLIFGFFGGSSHPSIKKSETIRAQDYPMCLGSGRGLPAPFPAYTLRTRTSHSRQRRYCELGLAGSERLFLPPKIGPYSLHALHQVSARDAKAKSDLGVIPAVYYPPLQQNSVRLGQLPDQGATSAALHVFRIPLNAVSMFHCRI